VMELPHQRFELIASVAVEQDQLAHALPLQ
jgi:hypothetical protein